MNARLAFSMVEERMVLRAIQNWSPRDRCLLVLGLETGLRIAMLSEIRVYQVYDGQKLRCSLSTSLPASKEARDSHEVVKVMLSSDALVVIAEQLNALSMRVGKLDPNAFLIPSSRHRMKLQRWQINRLVQRAARLAGLPNWRCFGGHSLRKTFAMKVYSGSRNCLVEVMRTLGHRRVLQTRRYLDI